MLPPEDEPHRHSMLLRLRRSVLLACCLLTPLVIAPGILQDPFNLPKLALVALTTIVAGTLALVEFLLKGRHLSGGSLLLPAGAMTMPLIAAWFVSPYQEWALVGSYTRYLGVIPYIVFALFGLVLFDTFRGNAAALAWTLSLSAALVGLYTFVQILGLDPVVWRSDDGREIFRQTSTIGNTNFLGGLLAIALPISLTLWSSPSWKRFPAMAATVFIAEGLLFSTSQGAWAAALAGCAWTVGALSGRPAGRRVGIIVTGLVAAALLTVPLIAAARPSSLASGVSLTARGHLWAGAWDMALERPLLGWGPNSYAVDGARHRDVSDVISFGEARPDDPHSIPAAFLANTGVTGFALWVLGVGILVTIAWRGIQLMTPPVAAGFAGAMMAYATQALVTVDVVTLRFALWVCAAGLAASLATRLPQQTGPPRYRLKFLAAGGAVVLAAATGAWWTIQAVWVDARVASAIDAFRRDSVSDGVAGFEEALAFRDEYGYRQLYSTQLALTALRRGHDGSELISRMDQVNSYLRSFPDPGHILARAQLLHYWGHYDRNADIRAVSAFRRALRLDPANYLIRIPLSEALIDLGRPDEAVAALQPAMRLVDRAPRLWPSFAIAALEAGDIEDGRAALAHARSGDPNGCRTLIAQAILRHKLEASQVTGELEQQIFFACDGGLFQFFLDRIDRSS